MSGEARAVVEAVRQALRSDPRVRPTAGPIHVARDGDAVLLEGEVADIAGKKRALEAAARVQGVGGVIDRLRVRPAEAMGDGAIREAVLRALLGESALADCTIRARAKGVVETLREPADATGTIEVCVADGVVTLDGEVAGLGRKRLAGVLAWWVPGSRDVVNGLGVEPPEDDSDAAIAEAVRQAIEADPAVDAADIQVTVRDGVVTLDGTVRQEPQRAAAEADAWYVFGVDDVINRLVVRP